MSNTEANQTKQEATTWKTFILAPMQDLYGLMTLFYYCSLAGVLSKIFPHGANGEEGWAILGVAMVCSAVTMVVVPIFMLWLVIHFCF